MAREHLNHTKKCRILIFCRVLYFKKQIYFPGKEGIIMDQRKIGRFLKELRNERALTQEQLAEIIGVTNRSISRWENGACGSKR